MRNIYLVIRDKGNVIVSIMADIHNECYRFVNLTKGHICSCKFDTLLDAVKDMQRKKNNGEIIDFIEINNF